MKSVYKIPLVRGGFAELEGKVYKVSFPGFEEFEFIAHRDYVDPLLRFDGKASEFWSVTEVSCGAAIVVGRGAKKEAVKVAGERLKAAGVDSLRERVHEVLHPFVWVEEDET